MMGREVRLCTCPRGRNGLSCPVHVMNNEIVQPFIKANPLFVQIAWELDLNWASEGISELFWQHTHVDGWEM